MHTKTLVLATEWNVSTLSGTDIDGYLLSVYRIVKREPTPDDPLNFDIEYRAKDMPFPTHDAADEWALSNGYLKEYEPKLRG